MCTHQLHFALAVVASALALSAASTAIAQQAEQGEHRRVADTFMPIKIAKPFQDVLNSDSEQQPKFQERQQSLLEERYDLSDRPSDVMMSGGRKPVQAGVRVQLPDGVTWDSLSKMSAAEIREQGVFPMGFRPLPHAKHETGGMVFPEQQIKEIRNAEGRDLERFDIKFDLPEHLTPEFPPPIFLTTRPDLGDVSQGKALTIKNYYEIMGGLLTPVQLDGLRLLLTPFPQQQFNATEDRKVKDPQLGVTCLDCHVNGHTNGTFHLNPDTRPQDHRFRIETVSLRGMFNQQIHGSKRSLRSVEDFTEFEQRTAYFDGDHITAAKKGVNLPDRSSQVAMMAQMQNMFDFPPAPKLDVLGRLDPVQASEMELEGEKLFFGKAKCAECHPAPFFLDDRMHDLKLGRFYDAEDINGQHTIADGPIKTFTLRGIKDSPPYWHDGRLMTLDDTVELFNVVLSLQLSAKEKQSLVAYLRCL